MTYHLEQVATLLDVSPRTVEQWVASRELEALNVSRNRGSRKPRLRITQAALDKFITARSTLAVGDAKPASRRRRNTDVPSYI